MSYEEEVRQSMEKEAAQLPDCPVSEDIDGAFAFRNMPAGKGRKMSKHKLGRNVRARRLSRKKTGEA